MTSDPRSGMRLRDLLMGIGVISLLVLLLLPAPRTAREAGKRTQCQNNMRQVGLGLMGFSNARNAFPNAGTFLDDPAHHQGDPRRSSIYPVVADPRGSGGDRKTFLRSWVVDILPYIDSQELYNAWNFQLDYLNTNTSPTQPTNRQIASSAIGILRCPKDTTAKTGQGNLSYVVNGGFVRWPAVPVSWSGSRDDGQSFSGQPLRWTPDGGDWRESQAVGKKLGVMFLGTQTGEQPWDIRTAPAEITDGASTTLLIGENTLAGYSSGSSPYSGKLETNWACPLPNFIMFLGSDNVCQSESSPVDCLGGQLAPRSPKDDGPGWVRSNLVGTFENIGFGRRLSVEGSFPFLSSGHPGGSNFVTCDGGVRFVQDTIDGGVFSKLITPAGTSLPEGLRQSPEVEFAGRNLSVTEVSVDGSVYSRLLTPAGGALPEAIRESRKGDSDPDLRPEDE